MRERLGRVVTVNGATGPITTFIIEPFVPHTEEYYLCIQVSPRYNGQRKKVVAGRFMCCLAPSTCPSCTALKDIRPEVCMTSLNAY